MTTFRVDVRAWLKSCLDTVVSSGELGAAYDTEPPSFRNEWPAGYVGDMPEDIEIDSQVMRRSMAPTIEVVVPLSDNNVSARDMDAAIDALVDAIAASPAVGGGVDRGSIQIEDFNHPDPTTAYLATRITLLNVDFAATVAI